MGKIKAIRIFYDENLEPFWTHILVGTGDYETTIDQDIEKYGASSAQEYTAELGKLALGSLLDSPQAKLAYEQRSIVKGLTKERQLDINDYISQ